MCLTAVYLACATFFLLPPPPRSRLPSLAVGKQKATQERKQKNEARAEELARGRKAREDAKKAAAEQAAIDRKEKQEGIAARIEVSRSRRRGGGGEAGSMRNILREIAFLLLIVLCTGP